MPETRDFLFEIGTEELPPKALCEIAEALAKGMESRLDKAGLHGSKTTYYATPRRLAVLINDLPLRQAEQRREKRGPALTSAYDKDGKPTKAAIGFAHSCGVEVDALEVVETDKGSWLVNITLESGAATTELIPEIIKNALADLPVPKRMRWGALEEEFVRPVHWMVLLLGDQVIDIELFNVSTGNESRGHRFHHPDPILIQAAGAYASVLQQQGKLVPEFSKRRDTIQNQAHSVATQVNGKAVIDSALLDEVTALVEWPYAILGHFDRRFLSVPAEVLICTMQDHQKYFPVVDASEQLLPYFITISNIDSKDPEQIRAGNERVIRPRFSDAEFFWLQDRKRPLVHHWESLKDVIFQHQLGSLYDKCERITFIVRLIAKQIGGNPDWAERAARLAKCDLLTQMVQEFPELQGTMGRYYALFDGEVDEVAFALEEQYLPRFAGDKLPQSNTSMALALADRLDTLIGIFAIGQAPTGAKDPFALRRAALGVLRILIESKLALNLEKALQTTAGRFPPGLKADSFVPAVFDFMMDRLRAYYLDQDFRADTIDAVMQCRPTCPFDFDLRVRAVSAFRELPEAESLAAANKRIRNILKKSDENLPFQVRTELLQEGAEQNLAGCLAELSSEVVPLMNAGMYNEALYRLVALKEPVDAFFDQVMVMAEEINLRNNRLALLNELSSLFLRVADFSRLQG